MKNIITITLVAATATLTGCAARQDISQFETNQPKRVCIAEHDSVRDGFLQAMEKGFSRHGVTTKVVPASYALKHSAYQPTVDPNNLENCDAIAFYVANWNWDLALYLAYANIWVTDPAMTQKIAQATYQTGHGLDKFIDAEDKVFELIDKMYGEYQASKSQ